MSFLKLDVCVGQRFAMCLVSFSARCEVRMCYCRTVGRIGHIGH